MHCLTVVVGGAGSHTGPMISTPPSGRMRPPLAQPPLTPPIVMQVQVAGQSASALHETAFGSQCFVVGVVQLHSGGGTGFGAGAKPPGGSTGSEGGSGAPPPFSGVGAGVWVPG